MNDPRENLPPFPSSAHSGRIVVVGPCAAGKTTLVNALCALGYDAHACAQEHSEIAALWRHSQPDVLIALNADLEAVRRRRGERWPEWLYDAERRRLADAYAAADLLVDTSTQEVDAILNTVILFLERRAQA